MPNPPTIILADDDDGHALLTEKNLRRGGVTTPIIRFSDGQEALDFLFGRSSSAKLDPDKGYILLLDIRMPKVDGIEVLRQVKNDPKLHSLPVIMLTTTDDPRDVAQCHQLGCNVYVHKPVDYEKFATALTKIGEFIHLLKVPSMKMGH
jgi:CheY-like chemotaxis protein